MNSSEAARWSEETDRELRQAGWYPGRSVPTADWERLLSERGGFTIHSAARRFLSEFGGLEVPHRGAGITMSRADFQLDPTVAEWDDEIIDYLSEIAGAHLYPVGASERKNNYLCLAPDGAFYLGMDQIHLLAATADEALDKMVRGIQ